jgi:hypothetical protein
MSKSVDCVAASPDAPDADGVRTGDWRRTSSDRGAVGDWEPEAVGFLSEGVVGAPDKIGPASGIGRLAKILSTDVIWHPSNEWLGDPLNLYWTLGLKFTVATGATLVQVGGYFKGSELFYVTEPDPMLLKGFGRLQEAVTNFILRHNALWDEQSCPS